jgi:hypothetical protein
MRCPGSAAQHVIGIGLSATSVAIPLQLPSGAASAAVKYLPMRYARLDMTTTPADGSAVRNVTMETWPATDTTFCTNVPSSFATGGSDTRRFAEAIIVLHNYVQLACQPSATDARTMPQAAFELAIALLSNNTALVVDGESIMKLLTAVVPALPDPVTSGQQLLTATAAALTPYAARPQAEINAHLAASKMLLVLLLTLGAPAQQATAVQRLCIARIHLASSVICARGETQVSDYGPFLVSTRAALPNHDVVAMSMGSKGAINTKMSAVSAVGYCMSAIALSGKTLFGQPSVTSGTAAPTSSPPVVRRLTGTAASPAELREDFNLPVFAIAADLQRAGSAASIRETVLRYDFPVSVLPATGTTFVGRVALFHYSDTDAAWVAHDAVTATFDMVTRSLAMTVTSIDTAAFHLSGVMTFTAVETPAEEDSIDTPLLATTLATAGVFLVVLFFGAIRDRRVDAATEGDDDRELALDDFDNEVFSVASLHRYAAVVGRTPHHPITTPQRIETLFGFVFAALFLAVMFAAADEAPRREVYGLFGGFIVAVLATPCSTLVRVPLCLQLQDIASAVAAGVGLLAGVVGVTLHSFALGALLCGSIGLVTAAVVGGLTRKRWSLKRQLQRSPLPAVGGTLVFATIGLTAVIIGVVYSTATLMPATTRTDLTAIATFLFAVAIDCFVLEPLKCLVLGIAATAAVAAEAEGVDATMTDIRKDVGSPIRPYKPPPGARHPDFYDEDADTSNADEFDDIAEADDWHESDGNPIDGAFEDVASGTVSPVGSDFDEQPAFGTVDDFDTATPDSEITIAFHDSRAESALSEDRLSSPASEHSLDDDFYD